jgi:hypothetical protein
MLLYENQSEFEVPFCEPRNTENNLYAKIFILEQSMHIHKMHLTS